MLYFCAKVAMTRNNLAVDGAAAEPDGTSIEGL
jgi:hypothetical protein